MVTTTRKQSICILFCVLFNEENVKKYVPIIDGLEGLEICYMEDPMEPIVISVCKINAYPFKYKLYPDENSNHSTAKNTNEDENKITLVNKAQVVDLLDAVFLPCDPLNEEVYDCKKVETKEILSFVRKHTNGFDKQNVNSFGKWLKSQKINLTHSPVKRVINSADEKVQVRNLYVMKAEYLEDTLKNVATYLQE